MVFVILLLLAGAVLEVPFQLYADFAIEQRHGFNRQTARLWWSDWLKSTLISLLLTAALTAGGQSDGAPALRPQHGEGYYAAFIRDPDGNRIEAVTFVTG